MDLPFSKDIFSRTPNQDLRCLYTCEIFLSHTPVSAIGKDIKRTAACWPHVDPCFDCLLDFILYIPLKIFQLKKEGSPWVKPVLSYDKCVLLKDHKAVTLVRLEPAAPRS